MKNKISVIVACEFSGVVRDAFKNLGHDAVSCDIVPSETPGEHIICDIRDVNVNKFDLLIAHPPCTFLCSAGARWWKDKQDEQREAIDFFLWFTKQKIPRSIENPIGIISSVYRKPDQIINPWQFGHGETKATCLWNFGIPNLIPTKIVSGREQRIHRMPPGKYRSKNRSRTYTGIASAMALQWGGHF